MIATPGLTRIGWIGTGVMGNSMCGHLIKAGYSCTVYNRTSSKTDALVAMGAKAAATPKELAQNSDIVFSIVSLPSDVEAVLLSETGALAGLNAGGIVVDMTTSTPSLAKRIYQECAARGVRALDAPVSGGDIGAREARLAIMVGGDASAVESVMPLFLLMGKNINHMGPVGSGQHTKMANQILVAGSLVSTVEALLYASKAGLAMEQTVKATETGAAGSWSLSNLGPRICRSDFMPAFACEHFFKDLGIILEEARGMGVRLGLVEHTYNLFKQLLELGCHKNGTQVLFREFERINSSIYDH